MTANVNNVLPLGTVFQGRYRVVRAIKAGSMGVVYEVIDHKTESRRALKVMLPGLVDDPDLRARFVQEAKITGGIESDHIIRVLDADVDVGTGTPFLVMDLLRGEELGRIVKRSGPLPHADIAGFLFQTAYALDKTHAAGIVHRDLKPQNLFLTHRDDGSPCVKILDFGIAKVFAQREAHATKAIGTPLYMAPEQIRGDRALGPRVDIYALGQIAYTLLAGEPYWNEELRAAGTIFPLLTRIVDGSKEAPCARAARRHAIEIPAGFDAWFLRATAVHPDKRFESASGAVAALSDVLGVHVTHTGRTSHAASDPYGRGGSSSEPPARGHGSSSAPELGVGRAGSASRLSGSPGVGVRASGSVPQFDGGNGSLPSGLGQPSDGTSAVPGIDLGSVADGTKSGLTPRVEMSMAASASAPPPRRAAAIAAVGGAVLAGLLVAFAVVVPLRPEPTAVPRDVAVARVAAASAARAVASAAPEGGVAVGEAPATASSAPPPGVAGAAVSAQANGPAAVVEPLKLTARPVASPRKGARPTSPAPTARPKRSIY